MPESGQGAEGPSSDANVIVLPAEISMETVSDFHAQLLVAVNDPNPVVLKADAVSRMHAAGLQCLCSFFRDRERDGFETAWNKPSEALREAATLLGLTDSIQLSQEPA